MSLKHTPEQEKIIAWTGNKLVVGAFAGTGKTSTLEAFARANPEQRMLYLAYNRAIRDEAERRFPFNVECKTSHQLAWPQFGRFFQHRLTASLRITDIAKLLNSRHWPLAKMSLISLNNFLYSADSEPGITHLPDENDRCGLDAGKILGAVQILWCEMTRPDSRFPVTHDTYLKLFQLSTPDLSLKWDLILFDEAQDANPVTSHFVLNQKCSVILVGDQYQQIYRFRGAENALNAVELADADRLWLTNSFRFGSAVAKVANALLKEAGEKRTVSGCGGADSVSDTLPEDTPHHCVISRTISGVIGVALTASLKGKRVCWIGGIQGYRVEDLEDLYWFSVDMPERMQTTLLTRDYRDFEEFKSIAKATKDADMGQAIKLLEMYFPLPQKLVILRRQIAHNENEADLTVVTAHRSKGLEWDTVVLNDDFNDINNPLISAEDKRDELNLLYVAATRARKALVLNEMMRQVVQQTF
ncbi:UvrD-helicase domain-containing protein [Duffyella gerundensis]|uniref:UvrD-helicase domain-containing protein n=1 Tax=Duffyella gerundensis TaxID=1619313 RepID=UPI001653F49F|nr:UvrD-helicase domain-containing protein [Duffyella gerundensis]